METVGSFISFFAALFAVFSRNTLSGGMAGLSVSYALSVSLVFHNNFFGVMFLIFFQSCITLNNCPLGINNAICLIFTYCL